MQPRHSPELSRIARWLRSADVICFLGFGFWSENFDLLLPDINRSSQIYSSAINLAKTVKDRVNGQISPARVLWG